MLLAGITKVYCTGVPYRLAAHLRWGEVAKHERRIYNLFFHYEIIYEHLKLVIVFMLGTNTPCGDLRGCDNLKDANNMSVRDDLFIITL